MVRRLAVVALLVVVAGCGAQPAAPPTAPPAAPPDPFAMVGWWRVEGTDQLVLLDPRAIELRDGPRTLEGSWRADTDAHFLAGLSSGSSTTGAQITSIDPPAWVPAAAGFAVDGPDRVLTDRAGAPVARLLPDPARPASDQVNPARAPSVDERQAAQPAAPAPAGLRPAGPAELVGRWVPEGFTGLTHPSVAFAANGTWRSSDGCNGGAGSWVAGAGGGFLTASAGVMTLIACDGVPVETQLGRARRAASDGTTLVLLDAAGRPTGRFARA